MPRKNKHNRKNRSDSPPPKVSKDHLISEALQFYALYSQLPFQKTNSNQYCYLLDQEWFMDWRLYSGYQAIVNQKQQKEAKIGQKHPGFMNKQLIDKKAELFEFPPQMPELTYLNLKLSEKADADDCVKLDQACWLFLRERYQGQEVKRPVSYSTKGKGYRADFDCELHSFYILVPAKSQLQEMRKVDYSTFEQNSQNYLIHKKIQVPCSWTTEKLTQVIRQFCSLHYSAELKSLWKFDNFVLFREIRQAVYKIYTQGGQVGLHATNLSEKQFEQQKLKYFLKEAYLVFAEIQVEGKANLQRIQTKEQPNGYCQSCLQIKELPQTCQCRRPYYCSLKCLHDDRAFHFRLCQQAYESDEEQLQWQTHKPGSTLLNLGNTCYMNSSLQALFGASELVQYLSQQQYKQECKQQSIFLNKASRLFRQVRGKNYHEPYSFKSAFQRICYQFKGYLQHDSCDFINYFLASLNQEIAPDKAACRLVLASFTGKFISLISCPVCKYQNASEETFTVLPLPIREKGLSRTVRMVIIKGFEYKFMKIQNPGQISSWEKVEQLSGLEQSWISIGKERGDLILVNPQQQKVREIVLRAAENKLDMIVQQGRPDFQHSVQIEYQYKTQLSGQATFLSFAFNKFIAVTESDSMADLFLKVLLEHQPVLGQLLLLKMEQIRASNQQAQQLSTQEKTKITSSLSQIVSNASIQIILLPQKSSKKNCKFCDRRNCKRCIMRPDLFVKARQAIDTQHSFYKICIRYAKQPSWYVSELKKSQKDQMIKLQDCLIQFSQPQTLDQQNAWYCQSCEDMRLAQKTLKVAEGPKYLIIQLKRFRTQGKKKLKNCEPVAYQEQLDFAGHTYSLTSVIIHEGSLEGGHYWALRKSQGEWKRWQDESVSQAKSGWSSGAYVLLYSLN